MAKMIQIRHVAEDVHRTLRRRAKRRGQSLSDYLRLQVEAWARQDTLDEALEGLQGLPQVDLIEAPAVTIRRDRDQERR